MAFSKLLAAFALSFLSSTALANPVAAAPRQATCKPNFQGRPLTIFKQPPVTDIGVYEWRPQNAVGGHISLVRTPVNDAFASDEFIVEFTGQPTNTYHFKLVDDTAHQLALSRTSSGDLAFAIGTFTPDGTQEFAIDCTSCSTTNARADGCVVSHPASGTCVVGANDGERLRLGACSSAPRYSFWEGL